MTRHAARVGCRDYRLCVVVSWLVGTAPHQHTHPCASDSEVDAAMARAEALLASGPEAGEEEPGE